MHSAGRWLVAWMLTATALAGCVAPGDVPGQPTDPSPTPTDPQPDPTPTPDTGPTVVDLTGVPNTAVAGKSFDVTLTGTGESAIAVHAGAHFWAQSTPDPGGHFSDAGSCVHRKDSTALPGAYVIACTIQAGGPQFIRAHARIETADGHIQELWGPEHTLDVEGGYTLAFQQPPPGDVVAGDAVLLALMIEGKPATTLEHVGAHYWTGPTADPTQAFANQAGACDHTMGNVPGTFDIECSWAQDGAYFLRGHARTASGIDVWTPEVAVSVGGNYAVSFDAPTPAAAGVGEQVVYTLRVQGPAGAVDHVGAHYWANPTTDPTMDFEQQTGACDHTGGQAPSAFEFTCVWDQPGVHQLFGHLRTTDGTNHWTSEHVVQVGTNYVLDVADDFPVDLEGGGSVVLSMTVEGPAGESSHIGGHYWTQSTANPTEDFDAQAGACDHAQGPLPGTYNPTCSFASGGTYYIRGHVRLDDGTDFWSQERVLDVMPSQTQQYELSLAMIQSDPTTSGQTDYLLSMVGPEGESTHIGAHYWDFEPVDPTDDFSMQAGACMHAGGPVPDDYPVTCSWDRAGTFYVYGHMRTADGTDHWAEAVMIEVTASFDLDFVGSTGPQAGAPEPYELTIQGPEGESTHIGAHYWSYEPGDPTADFAMQAGACEHQAGQVPNGYLVTCTFADAGTYWVYGHLRIDVGQGSEDHWAPGLMIEVV